MIRPCLAPLVRRAGLLLALTEFLPVLLCAQIDSTASSTAVPLRRQNVWASAGIGVGQGGGAGMASGWYSNNHFVVGAHAAEVSDLWDSHEVHDVALMLGVRNLSKHGLLLIAVGPSRLGGDLYVGSRFGPRTVARNEIGMAVAAEAIANLPIVGIGFDAFVALSQNRLVKAVVLSLQVGWLGN